MDYFPHDTHAISDDKITVLRMEKGLEAVACYWAVLEKIYEDEGPFDVSETDVGSCLEARSVSYKLGVGFDVLRDYVFEMEKVGLLYRVDCDGDVFMSERAEAQIEELNRKRETARENGKSGGRKPKDNQRRLQKKTKVGSSRKPKSGDIKTLNGIGFDKQNQIPSASVAADADVSAPPSAQDDSRVPVCPLCSEPIRFDAKKMSWHCGTCGDVKEPRFVEAVA